MEEEASDSAQKLGISSRTGTRAQSNTQAQAQQTPQSKIHTKKRFKGDAIKNVDGSGTDFIPFVGGNIDDVIANLNCSSHSSAGTASPTSMEGRFDTDAAIAAAAAAIGSNRNGETDTHSHDPMRNPQRTQNKIQEQQQGQQLTPSDQFQPETSSKTSNSDNSKSLQMRSPRNLNSGSSGISQAAGSPSSVELFSSNPTGTDLEDAMSTNNEPETSQEASTTQRNKNNRLESRFNNSVIDLDDNSTVASMASVATNTTSMTAKSSRSRASVRSRRRRKNRQQMQLQLQRQQQQQMELEHQQGQDENSHWETFWSSEHDCPYYHNTKTNEVTWENPNQPKVIYEDE